MRKLLIAAVVGLAIAIAAPIVVFAVGGSTGSFVPENDVYATTVSAASTSSASWHDVAGLSVAPCSTASAAATASLVLSGAPVDLRMKANASVMLEQLAQTEKVERTWSASASFTTSRPPPGATS